MTFRPLPARTPTALLRDAKPLKALFGEAQRLARLQALLESQLQPAARPHCRVASWRDGCLLLVITDGHWATRLRYQQPRLLRQLRGLEEFANLSRILFKVQPPANPQRDTGHALRLSETASSHLRETAATVGDPVLREALLRLASRAKKDDPQ